MNWQSNEWQDTRGARASGTGAAGKQQLRDEPSVTVLWAVSSSSFSAASKVCILTLGSELTGLAEELLQALERKESRKPAKSEDIPEEHEQTCIVQQMVDIPVRQTSEEIEETSGGQCVPTKRLVVLKGLSRRSDLNGRQAKVLSDLQSELIAVEILPKYGSIFTELVMEPVGEKVRVRVANFDFVGEEMVPTTVKPAFDEKAVDTSVEEGRE